jgi:tetratricopeptide (TPR) repeat protein
LHLGIAYQTQGDYRRSIDCLAQTMTALDSVEPHERVGEFLPAVFTPAYLAACHAELGTFAEGRSVGDKGLQIAEAVDHPMSLTFALWGSGLLALRQGDLSRAVPLLERAMRLCQDMDRPAFFPLMAAALGATYTLAGRSADAVLLLTQALEQTMATEVADNQTLCSLTLEEAQMLAGRLEEARPLPRVRCCSPARIRNGATRRIPYTSLASSRFGASLRIARWPQPTTGRPWSWPKNWACARSRRTATAV